MSKFIYTFTIDKVAKVSEKRVEKYTDDQGNEKERSISEEVEKKIPVEIQIRKPTRKQMQEAEMVFSIEMSRCIKAGILTKAMLMNKYSDNGGLVNSEDSVILDNAYEEINKLKGEVLILSSIPNEDRTKEEEDQIKEKQREIVNLRKNIVESEASYLSLFNHTADTKAQNKIVLWYVLNLSYYKDQSQGHKDFVPVFEGENFEEMEENLYQLEEDGNEIYVRIYNKLATVLSLWYFTGKTDTETFDTVLKENEDENEKLKIHEEKISEQQ